MAANSNGPEYGRSLNGAGVRRISRSASIDCSRLRRRIGTWNVRSMFQAGKIHNTIKEMQRLSISVLGISEMRWPKQGRCTIDEYTVYYSGEGNDRHQSGVALIVNKEIEKAIIQCTPISDRLIVLKVQAQPFNLNIVQVYAPTAECEEEKIEKFYNDLDWTMRQLKRNEVTILMGDLNAKVGAGTEGNVVGKYGLGTRNERGDKFVEFCTEHNLGIMNTFFNLPKRRLYTWKSPADSEENIIRNQIDYITINQRFRNMVKAVKTYPGADVPSDHNLLLANLCIKLKKINRPEIKSFTGNFELLKEQIIKDEVQNKLEGEFQKINQQNGTDDINEKWGKIKNVFKNTINSHLKKGHPKKKQRWMTNEILNLMEKRRQYRNKNEIEYKRVHGEIKRKIRQAKVEWFSQECEEIEEYDRKHDTFHLHKKIKETAGHQRQMGNNIRDENGDLIFETKQRLERWKQYVEQLFQDDRPMEHGITEALSGPSITTEEVENAIQLAKNRKAVGPDEIPAEVIKILLENGVTALTDLFNAVYNGGIIPDDWLESAFVPIPKKVNARECKDHRTISLMSHVLKIFLRIIHGRIHRKLEQEISSSQFGFRNGLGTREALFSLQVLVQRCRDVNADIFLCFLDFEKAFDRVRHVKMMELLNTTNIDKKDIRVIGNLYWGQKACIRVDQEVSEAVAIRRGVRQGCILSPLIFNFYSERIFQQALHNIQMGIKINGVPINNFRYADDTVLLANSDIELQYLLERVVEACNEYGLQLNTKKTKYMVISKDLIVDGGIQVNGQPLQKTATITYLGYKINSDWDHSLEIRSRIGQARTAFFRYKRILCGHDVSLNLKIRILRCYVFSVLLYGAEAWTLTDAMLKKLEAFELWCYRRILRISWIDRITNDTVLIRMNKEREIVRTIKTRKLSYFAHVMRNPEKYSLLQLVMQGKIVGKRGRGRRRTSWLKNLRQWFAQTSESLFRAAVNKIMIANMIANVR